MVADLNVETYRSSACRSCVNPTGWRCHRVTATSATSNGSRPARCRPPCWPACTPRRAARPRPLDAARAVLDEVPAIDVDYLEVRDTGLGPAPAEGMARMLLAARLGATRLLDNIAIDIGAIAGTDGHDPSDRTKTTNCHGGTDVTDNAEVEDPPRQSDPGGSALRRVGDDRRRPDGCRGSARGRTGHHRRHRQRRAGWSPMPSPANAAAG